MGRGTACPRRTLACSRPRAPRPVILSEAGNTDARRVEGPLRLSTSTHCCTFTRRAAASPRWVRTVSHCPSTADHRPPIVDHRPPCDSKPFVASRSYLEPLCSQDLARKSCTNRMFSRSTWGGGEGTRLPHSVPRHPDGGAPPFAV